MYNNPYFNQMNNRYTMPSQPTYIPPIIPTNNQTSLLGKTVENVEVVKVTDIPFDGSVSYFPLADGTAIVTKQFQNDGTTKTTIYKPVKEEEKELPKYVTLEEVKKEINNIDLSDLEDIKDEIKDLKKQLKDLKKKEE